MLLVNSSTPLNLSTLQYIDVSSLAQQLNSSDVSGTLAAQSNILSSLNTSVHGASNLTAGDAAGAANLVLALVTATPNISLTSTSQNQALNVLSAVAAAPINSSASGNVVVQALSHISQMALASNPAALAQVSSVVDTLTSSAGRGLLSSFSSASTAASSTQFSSENINATLSVALPGAASAPIGAPGATSSFDALPSGLLSSAAGANTAVLTEFRSLKFDPWANASNRTSLNTTGGSTRLAFNTSTGALVVANLSKPVTFTMPGVSTGSAYQAACSFYNTTSRTYATNGCIGVPNPQPGNHTLGFAPNATVPDDASLVLAWTIQGPMMETELCDVLVLNCAADGPCEGAVWGKSCVVYPNPRSPLAVSAVSCPANATVPPVLRVYYGEGCALWQPNTFNCTWNNTLQAFNGGGCVAGGNVTRCMCRHLTDFAAARVPKVTTCSLSDMTSFSAADIISKLKTLFELVVILFGIMHVGAAIGVTQDRAHTAAVVRHVTSPGMGFQKTGSGAWTWHLQQVPLQQAVGAPGGSAVALASVLGFPYIRLRVALPEEYLPGSVSEAIGRKDGLSLTGLESTQGDTDAAMEAILQALPRCLGGRRKQPKIPDSQYPSAEADAPATPRAVMPLAVTGPPVRQNAMKLIPIPEAHPPERVATELHDFVDSRIRNFQSTSPRWAAEVPAAPVMHGTPEHSPVATGAVRALSPEQRVGTAAPVRIPTELQDFTAGVKQPLARREDCLVSTALLFAHMANARCLPLVEFSQRRADATDYFRGVAVRGHTFEDLCAKFMLMLGDDSGSLVGRSKWMATARLWRLILLQNPDGSFDMTDSLAFALEAHAGPLPPATSRAEAVASGLLSKLRLLVAPPDDLDDLVDGAEEEDEKLRGEDAAQPAGAAALKDDPLTFTADTMLRAMPSRLERYVRRDSSRRRLWATLLALSWLEESHATWLVDEEEGKTIVDACHAYIDSVVARQRRLDRPHRLSRLRRDAERALRRWKAATQHAMQRARDSDALVRQNALVRVQNAGSRIVKSMMTDHDTFSTFLDTDGFIQRWQRFMILVTLLCSSLLTSIWFYSSRGIACCTEIRTLLDTGAGQTCATLAASDYSSLSHANAIVSDRMSVYLLPSAAGNSSAAAAAAASTGCDPALPAGPCLGSLGACGDLPTQFANLQGAYVYGLPGGESCHTTLGDYVCHAFPDDAYVTDQIFVGLICVAVALPVTMFLERAFETANEVDGAAEGWVIWGGLWRLVMGKDAHKRWRWTTSPGDPPGEFVQLLTTDPGYIDLAKFAASKALRQLKQLMRPRDAHADFGADEQDRPSPGAQSGDEGEEEEAYDDAHARRGALVRRAYAAAGLLGVYVTWAIFSWFIFTYGMIIYRRLGPEAEKQFVKTWGVGVGMDNVQQWRDVGKEALKAAALIIVLDMLRVTSHRSWFEEFCDFASVQALLFKGTTRSLWGQVTLLVRHQSRVQAG